MEIPVESWYEAIHTRRSRRVYQPISVPPDKLGRLSAVCQKFRPFQEARTVLINEPGENVYRGFIGSYGKIIHAPGYIAFIGSMDSTQVQEAVGYTGEGIILEARVSWLPPRSASSPRSFCRPRPGARMPLRRVCRPSRLGASARRE